MRGLGRWGKIAALVAAVVGMAFAQSMIFAPTSPATASDALSTIYFDYDRTDLRPDAVKAMRGAANFLCEHTGFRVMVEGHANERGTSAYNVGLGEARARSVRDYLVSSGIDADRIQIISYGRDCPANTRCGGNEECRANNRRVEWRILSQ